MKIVFVVYDQPDSVEGPLINARRLLPELIRHGHQSAALVVSRAGDSSAAKALANAGVRVSLSRSPLTTRELVRWILRELAGLEPDVFVPNISVAGYFAARWARRAGIPTIAALRSDDEFHWAMVDQFVVGPADWAVSGLVCVSKDLERRVIAMGPKHTRVRVIPSGVPIPETIVPQAGPLNLVYLGRLENRQKRIDVVAERMIGAVMSGAASRGTIVGTGSQRPASQKRIGELGLSDRIRVTGYVDPSRLPEILPEHHVVLLFSDYEGIPGALMDAMAYGLIPIVTNIPGGTGELVEHERTGLVIGDSEEAFLAALRRLARDVVLRGQLAAAARDRIVTGYSLDEAARRWIVFCQELLADAGPRRAIEKPLRLRLPPRRRGLDVEDERRPRWWLRFRAHASRVKKALHRGRSAVVKHDGDAC